MKKINNYYIVKKIIEKNLYTAWDIIEWIAKIKTKFCDILVTKKKISHCLCFFLQKKVLKKLKFLLSRECEKFKKSRNFLFC